MSAIALRHRPGGRHEVRLRRFRLAAGAYLACFPLLAFAWLLGLMPGAAALALAGAILAANLGFWLAFATRANERFADPSLTWAQICVATAAVMFAVYEMDANRAVALMMCLVVLAFGIFRFDTREFLTAAGVMLAGYAAVINLLFWTKPDVVNVPLEGFQWVMLAIVLPCFAVIGGRLSEARRRMRRMNDDLAGALATIQRMATHDTLTALPNRALFNETLAHAIAKAGRHDRPLALFFLDIDRFKNINDTLGHAVGDRVLQEASRRLQAAVRQSDFIARLGGDEFVLLVEDVADPAALAEVAAKVLAGFAPTLTIDGQELGLSVSLGICAYPRDGRDAATLLANADIAMYRAKDQGRNRFCFYSADLNKVSQERLSLEAALRHALERGEIEVHYQPKIAFGDGAVTGVEALIRWCHPQMGLLAPDRFVPLAEETGDIIAIGYWTLEQACRLARRWEEQGLALSVAVNLSATQFHEPELAATLAAILRSTGASARSIELEITESMVMRDTERAVAVMESLRAMGVRLAIDDFGTGHSSLGYLKRFPVEQLKVDRSFVRDLPHNGDDVAITRAVIAMAHSLDMRVVAEGVEHREQYELLRAEGCDEFQGYYCRPPLREPELLAFLAERGPVSPAPSMHRPLHAT